MADSVARMIALAEQALDLLPEQVCDGSWCDCPDCPDRPPTGELATLVLKHFGQEH